MERKIEATILEVNPKDVTRKRDGARITIYEVETDKGQVTTSLRRIAEEAYNHMNEPMLLTIDEVQRGDFTNVYLNKVELPFGNGQTTGFGSTPPSKPRSQFGAPQGDRGGFGESKAQTPAPRPALQGADKDADIHRQVAVKVAAWLVGPQGTVSDFRENVRQLSYFLDHGEWLSEWGDETPDQSGDRQFIPEGTDPGQPGWRDPDEDSIPF